MTLTMKASVYSEYGSPAVLRFKEVTKPVPTENEILVKIYATTVSAVDAHFRQGTDFYARLYAGIRKPRNGILGGVFAGEVVDAGTDVTLFKKGDQVFGVSNFGLGAHAEYKCLPEDGLVALKPATMSYEEAAGLPEALTALYFLRDLAHIHQGQQVLINGASGAIGTYAVQLAHYFGAEVTGVCGRANVGLVKSLGAAKVIDYTKVDFTQTGETYDVIFDAVAKNSFSRCKRALKQHGIYLTTASSLAIFVQMGWTSIVGGKKAVLGFAGLNFSKENLIYLKELAEAGAVKSVIDSCYPFAQIAEAHRHVDKGHKKGNVVLAVAS